MHGFFYKKKFSLFFPSFKIYYQVEIVLFLHLKSGFSLSFVQLSDLIARLPHIVSIHLFHYCLFTYL